MFEPVTEFFEVIKNRFKNNSKIKVFNFGLSDSNTTVEIGLDADRTSIHSIDGKNIETIKLKKIDEVMLNNNVEYVNLLKINIEGGEFPLLKYCIINKLTNKFENIQVQFHTFVNFAVQKRAAIQKKLNETHFLTYNYNFVWENWQIGEQRK